jgi:hypothetical protein
MAISKEEDFIFETSSEDLNGVRLFFGLKKMADTILKIETMRKYQQKKQLF